MQRKAHAQNQVTTRLLLEQAVAVTEGAIFKGELAELARVAIQRGEPGENVLYFDTICTDVLNRGSANRPWYQTEIFQPDQALIQRPEHERMPRLPCFSLDQYLLCGLLDDALSAAGDVQHQRRYVTRQQEVATPADGQQWHIKLASTGKRIAHITVPMRCGEILRALINGEGVERLQRTVGFYGETHSRPFISASSASLASSMRSSTSSKPSVSP